MRPQLTILLAAGIAAASPLVLAEDGNNSTWSGSATMGLRYTDSKTDDPSKLTEYRDLGTSSMWGGFEIKGRSDTGYLNLYGENLGRDDQYLDVKGGAFGAFKFRLYSDELRHNLGLGKGALTPFLGAGSANLSATLPNPNVSTWNQFEQSYSRVNKGGMLEWQATSPVYIRFDANEVKREGVNVFSGANGTSPGNGFTNVPVPIDYTTQNMSGEIGYSSRTVHLAVNALHSNFDNANSQLRWNNGYFGNGLDTTVLPPSNQLNRLSVNGNLRQLPWNSTIAGRLVFSQLTDDVPMLQTILAQTSGAFSASNPNNAVFHGDIKRTNLSLSWTAHPANPLDTRLYYDYAKEKNDSTQMDFVNPGTGLTGGTCTATDCSPELFHYKKSKLGLEAGYRINRENRLTGGLEHSQVDRERIDFDKTKDTRAYVQYKNTSLDTLSVRVKYQYLQRKSDFNDTISLSSGNPIDFYVRRFDLANVNQNLLKLSLDATPAQMLDLGFEAIFKNNDYQDTILGRTKDQRHEYYASVSFGDPRSLRTLVFGDYEAAKYDSMHRTGSVAGNPDPSTPPTGTDYNWTAKNEDKSWQVGAGLDWQATASVAIKTSLVFSKTEGSADFTAQVGNPLPITNFDNTKTTSFNVKAVYAYDRHWDLTGGFAYEKYTYDDIGYTGSFYVTSATATAGLVSGQYTFQPYTANIIYTTAKYKF